ncbi:MAG: hypothetical protein ABGW76_01480 [Mesonia sp.]|uniref:hypothetical protein n=1 Tax=Mesonia sp. TaxID=1960830 RepID=UPI00324240A2
MLDLVFVLALFFIGFSVNKSFKTKLKKADLTILHYLWVYHFLFGIIYWYYVSYVGGGDALHYYREASSHSIQAHFSSFLYYGPGTSATILLASIPCQILSFFSVSIFFSFLGHLGILYFYLFFIKNIYYNSKFLNNRIFPIIFFLPNLHFWSAGLGKDTLLFLSIALFFYGMQNPLKNVGKLVLALGLSYLIRPHITIFLITSFGLAFVLDGKLKSYQKILFFGLCLAGFLALFDTIMAYLKLESLDTESVSEFADTRVSNLSKSSTGSSVDISSYPFPLKIFTFLYRPLFFDINGVMAIIASFENLLLLILSWKFLRLNPIKMFKKGNYLVKGLFIFLVIGAVSFSLILSNLGIMLRQKNMFIPALLFICLWGFSYQKEKQLTKAKLS